jgi:hypothetical protein
LWPRPGGVLQQHVDIAFYFDISTGHRIELARSIDPIGKVDSA